MFALSVGHGQLLFLKYYRYPLAYVLLVRPRINEELLGMDLFA
ncbi:MAG: hypothetical protein H6Q68_2229 [Firmicutes bacterium]|nr:hypothetical protein [Bacillota bacterium]